VTPDPVILAYDRLADLPAAVARPRRTAPPAVGIVHFGPGAFHRAHQAAYLDRLLDDDPRWGIAAVSMRSRGTVDALARSQGLYTLAIRDREPGFRVIGAHAAALGPADHARTHALLASPATRLVTTTVTEKGYCLRADGTLDLGHPDIVHDLAGAAVPASVVGWIVAGLARRRAAGTLPYTVMPCDNLAANGAKLRAALVAFAQARDPDLAAWIAGEVRVPATMVDSITPASDQRLAADLAALGIADDAAVQREPFAQWVIEDVGTFGGDRGPDLAAAGATLTDDVAAFERAKLRILNGAHSTLAYLGLLRGHAGVADAMADPPLAAFVEAMIRAEVIPTLPPLPGADLHAYADAVFARFRNPAIVHRLDQIAQDGSQKLPYRLGDTLALRRRSGAPPGRIAVAIGGWAAFLAMRTAAGIAIVDPQGPTLAAAAAEPARVVERLAAGGLLPIDPALAADPAVTGTIDAACRSALAGDWPALLGGG